MLCYSLFSLDLLDHPHSNSVFHIPHSEAAQRRILREHLTHEWLQWLHHNQSGVSVGN